MKVAIGHRIYAITKPYRTGVSIDRNEKMLSSISLICDRPRKNHDSGGDNEECGHSPVEIFFIPFEVHYITPLC